MKVADLFAALRLKPDQASFNAADKALTKIKSGLRDVAALASAALVGLATNDFLNFDEQLADIDVATEGAMGSFESLRDRVLDVSDATGLAKEQVAGASAAFVTLTGDGKVAAEQMGTFARVMKASKASAEGVAGTAAAMSQQFGVAGKDFEQGFSMMIRAGKAGAVELRDLASVLPELGGLATQFAGGKGLKGLAELTAALQVVASGTGGNAAKARTQIQALYTTLLSKVGELKGIGVSVMEVDPATGKKVARNFRAIVDDIAAKGLSTDRLVEMFGSVEATNAFLSLAKNGSQAWDQITRAQMGARDVAEDYAKRQRYLSTRVAKAWNLIKNAVTRALTVVAEHLDLVALAVVSLGLAMIALKAKAIIAAVAMGGTFMVSISPILGVAAAIAGILFVLNDLYSLIMGGDSIIADFASAAAAWLWGILGRALSGIKMGFIDMWNAFVDGMSRAGQAVKDVFWKAVDWVVEKIEWLLDKVEAAIDRLESLNPFGQESGISGHARALAAREGMISSYVTPDMLASARGAAPGATVTVGAVQVTPPAGADTPEAYGAAVRTEMQRFWDDAMRAAATALDGGG